MSGPDRPAPTPDPDHPDSNPDPSHPGSNPDPSHPGSNPDPADPGSADPAAFHFLSRWELSCSREEIWGALVDFHTWPEWWPGLRDVVEMIHGDPEGIGQKATSVWRGPVGYTLRISIESVERIRPEFLRGVASGDVIGEGSWHLRSLQPDGEAGPAWTELTFDWDVRANRRWMEMLAPLARPVFVASHDRVMERGATGLADHLGCDLRRFTARVG